MTKKRIFAAVAIAVFFWPYWYQYPAYRPTAQQRPIGTAGTCIGGRCQLRAQQAQQPQPLPAPPVIGTPCAGGACRAKAPTK